MCTHMPYHSLAYAQFTNVSTKHKLDIFTSPPHSAGKAEACGLDDFEAPLYLPPGTRHLARPRPISLVAEEPGDTHRVSQAVVVGKLLG